MEFITDLITVYFVGSVVSILASMIYTAVIYRCGGKMKSNLVIRLIMSGLFSWVSAVIIMAICIGILTHNIDIKCYEHDSKYLDTSLLVKLRKEAQSAYKIHKLGNRGFMVIGNRSTKYWNSEPIFSSSKAKREYTRVVIQRMKALVLNLRREHIRIIEYSPWDKVTKL